MGGRLLTSAARGVFVPPEKRRMGMVFQTYAIWPHMTVFENIAFPLREQRVRAGEIRERVMAMLDTLGLAGFHDRPAPLLSGGQQQRVALGRALVADPDVLLLDEPFSNLDARLREEMRLELKELQARVGVTTLFVTHDQAEAMILSDRVFVMNAGRIAQEGSPRQIDERAALARSSWTSSVRSITSRRGSCAPTARASHGWKASTARGCRWPRCVVAGRRSVVLAFRSSDVRVCCRRRRTLARYDPVDDVPRRAYRVRRPARRRARAGFGAASEAFAAGARCSCRFRRARSGRGRHGRRGGAA